MILIKGALLNNSIQDLLIEGNKIKRIGKNLIDKENLNKKDLKIIDGKNKMAIPGLVNTHTHTPMTLFRGVADDLPLMEWLNDYIWKMEAKLNEDIVYAGTLLGCIEMIKSGTTTFNDMYFYLDGIIKAVKETGIRGFLSYGMMIYLMKKKEKKNLKPVKKPLNT